MKKIIFLLIAGIFSTGISFAYPAPNMNVGGAPFQLIQQQTFQRTEFNNYKQFRDANDKPAAMRTDSPKQLQEEYKIKELKQPAKIELGGARVDEPQVNTSDMQLIRDNGKIRIKYGD